MGEYFQDLKCVMLIFCNKRTKMPRVLIFLEKLGGINFYLPLKKPLINKELQKVFQFFMRYGNQNFSLRKLVMECYFFTLKKIAFPNFRKITRQEQKKNLSICA